MLKGRTYCARHSLERCGTPRCRSPATSGGCWGWEEGGRRGQKRVRCHRCELPKSGSKQVMLSAVRTGLLSSCVSKCACFTEEFALPSANFVQLNRKSRSQRCPRQSALPRSRLEIETQSDTDCNPKRGDEHRTHQCAQRALIQILLVCPDKGRVRASPPPTRPKNAKKEFSSKSSDFCNRAQRVCEERSASACGLQHAPRARTQLLHSCYGQGSR